ncbi:MAG: SDR family oxidoreductase [Myxococcales bacterium]|nr:SDR family oxidoreductase [Myxococcales bacterium]
MQAVPPPSSLKRVLVTGASGAVGHATCELLAARGHRVAGTMRRRGGKNSAIAAALEARGVTVIELDVTDDASVDAGLAATLEALGGLDVVFNNAGVGSYGIQELFSADEMHRVFDVNVYGVQRVMRAALPQLRGQGGGTIVYTSSLIGRVAIPFYGTYCASKWALEAMAQAYRAELARFGVDSVIVEPGALPTAFLDGMLTPADRSDDYAPETAALGPALTGMVEWLKTNPAQTPEMVARIVADVIDLPGGEKPFRVIADQTGMGEAIAGYNEALGQATRSIYAANGMAGMLGSNAGPT